LFAAKSIGDRSQFHSSSTQTGNLSEIAIGEQPGGVKKIQDEVFTHKVRLLEPFLNLSTERRK